MSEQVYSPDSLWQEIHGYRFVPAAEALKAGFTVIDTRITPQSSPINLRLTQFPDLDGRGTHIPRFVDGDDHVVARLKAFGASISEPDHLDPEFLSKFNSALDLGWPILLASHLATNSDHSSIPEMPDKNSHSIVNLLGRPRAGKSLLVASIALKRGVPFFSFDQFSPYSAHAYLDYFIKSGLTANSSPNEIFQAVNSFQSQTPDRPSSPSQNARPLRSLLDELVQRFKESPSPFCIADAVSATDGMDTNIYHLAASSSEASISIAAPGTSSQLSHQEDVVIATSTSLQPHLGIFTHQDLTPEIFGIVLEQVINHLPDLQNQVTNFKASLRITTP